jgi:hypothetical protein
VKAKKKAAKPSGPVSIRVLTEERLAALHRALASFLERQDPVDAESLSQATAWQFEAGSLAGDDPRAQAALLMLGLRESRPCGVMGAPLAWLAALTLLDQNGHGPDEIPFTDISAAMAAVGERTSLPRRGAPEGEDEASALFHWLQERTRPLPAELPLALPHLQRALAAKGFTMARTKEGWEVQRTESTKGKGLLGIGTRTVKRKVAVHAFPEPADGLVSLSALRALKEACGLPAEEGLGDAEGRLDALLRQHRTLWPRLMGLWS